MANTKIIALTSFTMAGFASNSILCRLALTHTNIDASSFTSIRILSGALSLYIIAKVRGGAKGEKGRWLSSVALFVYAAGFSFAYLTLSAATGALLLFSAVQVTMIGHGLWSGERLSMWQYAGLILAFGGLVILLLPGLSAPPLGGSFLMIGAGIGWGIYSLRGRGKGNAITITAGNFLRAVPIAALLVILRSKEIVPDPTGIFYAIVSGGLATGIVYVIWYTVLPELKDTSAAIVQLSVPIIAALGGIVFLGEPVTLRYILAAVVTLGGISLVFHEKRCDNLRAGPC